MCVDAIKSINIFFFEKVVIILRRQVDRKENEVFLITVDFACKTQPKLKILFLR